MSAAGARDRKKATVEIHRNPSRHQTDQVPDFCLFSFLGNSSNDFIITVIEHNHVTKLLSGNQLYDYKYIARKFLWFLVIENFFQQYNIPCFAIAGRRFCFKFGLILELITLITIKHYT